MLKKVLLLGCFLSLVGLSTIGCDKFDVVIHAQSLPITKTFTWDANPPADGVLNYTVALDGVTVGSPTGITQAVIFTTVGAHVVSVTATNMWGTGPATSLSVNVTLPSAPKNLKQLP